jgi:hypothetical protein
MNLTASLALLVAAVVLLYFGRGRDGDSLPIFRIWMMDEPDWQSRLSPIEEIRDLKITFLSTAFADNGFRVSVEPRSSAWSLFRAPVGFVERYTLLRVLQTIFQRRKLVFKSKNLWVRSTYYLHGGPTRSRSFM